MKSLKPALLFLSLVLLFSCSSSNNDYAYNEKVTSIFLREMKQIDETDSVFKDTSKVYAKGFPDSILLSTKAENLINNSKVDLVNIADLKPGKEAVKFNEGVIAYLTAINDYGKTAQEMLQVKTTDEKKKLHDHLMLKYEKLNTYPDSLLEIQKVYLNEVGLQPK
ncbi:hypothetical protein ASU31_20680 [Pedobacter ginsenosidimutans]|uniref:DUF4142 domain-containing protein n=1 Tax=Pedobacter ginsenosidimutans TaxID=687842 RepID=A0A0T5VJZ4_9SPHI|nr:hypothetical protein [Pedobacter ginsenosidimutans]KRT14160.1 hypothetical protein ASU31_20680 [Pedobacter ginsenosidimutans]